MHCVKYTLSSGELTHIVARARTRGLATTSRIYAYSGGSRSHYEVLGVPKDCTTKEIRNAYIEKCKILHPDVGKSRSDEEFIAVQNAYEILVDEGKRRGYDNRTTYSARHKASWQDHRDSMRGFEEFYGIRRPPPGYKHKPPFSNIKILWCGVLLAWVGAAIQLSFVFMENKRISKDFEKNSKRLMEELYYGEDMQRRERLVKRYKEVMKETSSICPDKDSPLYFWSLQKVMVSHGILGQEYLDGHIMDSNFLLNVLMEHDDYDKLVKTNPPNS